MKDRKYMKRVLALGPGIAVVYGLVACGETASSANETIKISGSATVEPVTAAVARSGDFDVDMSAEGSNAGFERFCNGETAINNSSTPISTGSGDNDFAQQCESNGVEFIEVPVGLDAISLVHNSSAEIDADFTMRQLRDMWSSQSEVEQWSDVDPSWPQEDIGFYGRSDGSGTFEEFTTSVNGRAGDIREDYEVSDDIAELSEMIADDPNGIGFMSVGNYLATDGEERIKLSNSTVDDIAPVREQVQSGEYPLSRPIFIYVNKEALEQEKAVKEFVDYYVANVEEELQRVHLYALPTEAYPLVAERVDQLETGTLIPEGEGTIDVLSLLQDNE